MTIHRAKGLEFESVILYDINQGARSDTEPLLRFEQSRGRVFAGMIKASDSEEKDQLSLFIGEREKQRSKYELQRLMYVAVTRARSQLHLVGLAELNKEDEVSFKKGSLLELLWPIVETDFQQANTLLKVEKQAEQEQPAHAFLHRLASLDALPRVQPYKKPMGVNQWEWTEEPFKEAAVGTVAHAWLERIGRDGRSQWATDRITQSTAVIERQLLRAGVTQAEVSEAVIEVQDTLIRTLSSERGQWVLDVAQAYREWTLLDAEGRVSIIDLAISQDNQWLIVDYKTAKPNSEQSDEEFLTVMRNRYAPQLRRYCEQVTAFDGRKAVAALYFPRADLWCEL